MSDDLEVILELASELSWTEAAKFIRRECCGAGLRGAIALVEERVVTRYPDSTCAKSWNARP